jgi:predicted  nucleic acid-binding Zn ribbon protein
MRNLFYLLFLFVLVINGTVKAQKSVTPLLDSVLKGYTISVIDSSGKKYVAISREAIFKGSVNNWRNYLAKNLNGDLGLKYIKLKRTDSILTQSVDITFVVNQTGYIGKIIPEQSDMHPKLIEEAIRVIEQSPRWAPAELAYFEIINGDFPVNKILDQFSSGFRKVIYAHKQKITFSCSRSK